MGCCQGNQKLRFSNNNMTTQNHAQLPPPTGAYHLNYVPPITNNTYTQNNSVMMNNNAIGSYQINQTGRLSDQFYQSNGFSNAVQTNNNLFRQSNVPMPNFMPINVELKDLQTFKRF